MQDKEHIEVTWIASIIVCYLSVLMTASTELNMLHMLHEVNILDLKNQEE
jgi:hypothetical protein